MDTCTICEREPHFTLRMRSDRFGMDAEDWGLCEPHLRSLTQWRRDQRDLEGIPSMQPHSAYEAVHEPIAEVRVLQARLEAVDSARHILEAEAQEIPPLRAIKDAVKVILAHDPPPTHEEGAALALAYLVWAKNWGTPEHP